MNHSKRISASGVGRKLRAHFIIGILIVVPGVIAVSILVWLFNYIDNIAQPVAKSLLGRTIPGLGLGIMILPVYLAGVAATNVIGRPIGAVSLYWQECHCFDISIQGSNKCCKASPLLLEVDSCGWYWRNSRKRACGPYAL